MGALNRIILTGNLVADPEVRYTEKEIPVAHFRLAVNRIPRNGSKEKEADFISCVAWRNLAKICGEYLKKGRLVAVEGRLQIRPYETKGQKKSFTEVIVDNLQMLDTKFFKATDKKVPAPEEELALA
jgi:single-strand DNA-binding protein